MKRDLPARALALAVRALPAERREWGLAMQAELAAIEDAAERRGYALGSAWAVLARPGTLLRLGAAPAVGLVSLVLALKIGDPGVRAESLVLIAVLAGMLRLGRDRVAPDRTSRRVRGAACATVGVLLIALLWPSRGGGHSDPSGAWIAGLAVVLYLGAALAVTATRGPGPRALRTAVSVTAAAIVPWWAALLLSSSVRSHPGADLALAASTAVVACAIALRQRPARAAIVAGLGAGAATCLLVTLLALGTYAARPDLVPHFCGTSNACGLTPAARAETERIEASDPYVADLLLGALLAGLTLAGVPGRRRARG